MMSIPRTIDVGAFAILAKVFDTGGGGGTTATGGAGGLTATWGGGGGATAFCTGGGGASICTDTF